MRHRIRGISVTLALLVGALCMLGLSACGGDSSSQAKNLLKQTFGGTHKVESGNLNFSLTLDPSGSSTITTPLTFGFSGPFQSLGTGKLPASNFTVTLSGLGRSGSLGLLSTGQSGFVTLQGSNYQMPAATFQRLESSFSGLTTSASGSSGSALSKLGIDPLRWLINPSIAGDESVGGATTTHIKASINVAALLGDLNTFLQKASTAGVAGATRLSTSISPATKQKIASEVKNPRFDVWTGKGDKTPRRLSIQLTLPVTGQVSTLLGGLRFAGIALNMQYGNLNQPQTIAAPSTVRPFSEFTAKLKAFEQALQGILGAASSTGGTSSTTPSSTAPSSTAPSSSSPSSTAPSSTTPGGAGAQGTSSAPSNVQAYSSCVQAAGGDVAKLQACAALLNK